MPATATPLRPRSTTTDPLLLNTERLHRVDASQLPQGCGVSLGHCRTDMGVCLGHPECADTACPGHPCNDTPDSDRDPALTRKVLVGYVAVLLLCSWAAWQWLSR